MNIVITGFMGTGKSAAGKIVAERLGWEFFDTDEIIEKDIGIKISEIFNKKVIALGGDIEGYTAYMMRFIDDDVCIITLSNFGHTPIGKINIEFAAILFGQKYELPKKAKKDNAIYEKYKDQNFTILSISFDRRPIDIKKFRKKKWKMPWFNAYIEDGFSNEIARNFEVYSVPKPIFVDPNGKIIASGRTLRLKKLEEVLNSHLEKVVSMK